jgi:octaprenyl-diphosphate synthase
LAYAESKMVEFQQEALLLLDNYSNSDFKEAPILMVNYVIERKK